MLGPTSSSASAIAATGLWLLVSVSLASAQSVDPVDLGDGWSVSAPESQGLDVEALRSMARIVDTDSRFRHAYALLVVRHGVLVGETYFNGRRAEQTSDVRSVTKSLTSMAYGMARAEGIVPASLDVSLRDLLPGYADLLVGGKEGITIRDALTMQAGLRWDDTASPWLDRLFSEPDLVGYVLAEPQVAEPGVVFRYSSGLTQVIGRILMEHAGTDLRTFVDRRLFRPLGIEDWGWLRRPNGDDFAGLGARLRPRDMAKIGQMTLQSGLWQGRRVVPADWLRESTRDRTAEGEFYGYQWWAPRDGSYWVAIGYGGQYIYCDPALDVVVVLQVNWNVPADGQVGFGALTLLLDELQNGVLAEQPGRIRAPQFVAVDESTEVARVELVREGGSDGDVEIAYRTRPGSAQRDADYEARTGVVRWAHGEAGARLVDIPIVADDVVEGVETFRVLLERSSGGASLSASAVTVELGDAGEPQNVQWSTGEIAVRRGEPAVLELVRSSASGALEVGWEARPVADSQAQPLSGPVNGTLTFAPGEVRATLTLEASQLAASAGTVAFTEVAVAGSFPAVALPPAAIVAVTDGPPTCQSGTDVLCLRGDRFRVRGQWRTGSGERGVAGWTTLSDESAWGWFFSDVRLELLVKVLDGRGVNGAHWLFYGALSDVEYLLVVEDLLSGEQRLYHNPLGGRCGRADTSAFPEVGERIVSSPTVRSTRSGSASQPASRLLGRFDVRVRYSDAERGLSGDGRVEAISDETALVWFFEPSNTEMAVKVLDGRGVNGHFWVFAGAQTDLDYVVEVTDAETGVTRRLTSEQDLCALTDIEAFAAETDTN